MQWTRQVIQADNVASPLVRFAAYISQREAKPGYVGGGGVAVTNQPDPERFGCLRYLTFSNSQCIYINVKKGNSHGLFG